MAYHWFVGSSGPVSRASSAIGLRRQAGIDTGRAEKHQLVDSNAARALDDVILDGEVFVDELRRLCVVGNDAADLCRGQEDRRGPLVRKPRRDIGLPFQIEFSARRRQDLAFLAASRRTSAEPTMPR